MTAVRLIVACLCLCLPQAATAAPQATLLGSYLWPWPPGTKWFGGFSGLDVTEDGNSFWVVSDSGFGSAGRFTRDAATGEITAVTGYKSQWLQNPGGEVVQGIENDAEDLSLAPGGEIYVSFEGDHRVLKFASVDAEFWAWAGSELIPPHPDFKNMQNNSSLESVCVAPDGAILTMPERSGVLSRPFPVYRYRAGNWDTTLSVPRRPPYLMVGCDFGPDGRFYVLERNLNGIFGFESRVRRFDYGEDALTGEVTLFESKTGQHDNLEGIGVWRDDKGRIRLTMVSDNNFRSFQRNQIVEYVVEE